MAGRNRALRAGGGKLVVATAASVATGLALRLPEARVIGLPETRSGGLSTRGLDRLDQPLEDADAVLLGPGLRDERAAGALVKAILARSGNTQIVLDAWPLTRRKPLATSIGRLCSRLTPASSPA